MKCNSLTILIVTVTLSAGQYGYVNFVVTSSCDTFDSETVGQNCCYLCKYPQETKNTVHKKACASLFHSFPLPHPPTLHGHPRLIDAILPPGICDPPMDATDTVP